MLATRRPQLCSINRNRFMLHYRSFISESKSSNSAESTTETSPKPPDTRWFWRTFFIGSIATAVYIAGKPKRPDDEQGIMAYGPRALNRAISFFSSFEEPAFEKLLPDQHIDPAHPRPYTLVLDLDNFLVCHLWDRETSRWRIAKRPGADLFLFYAAQLYEVVIFSQMMQHEGDAIVKGLDKFGCVTHALYRFATTHSRGRYLKNIAHLNRDPSKVIVLGHDINGFSPHPENHIPMQKWNGDSTDESLERGIDFLEQLAFSRAQDIRPIIKEQRELETKYSSLFPESFDRAQEEAFERARRTRAEIRQKRSSNWFFNLLFGGVASTASSLKSQDPSYPEKKQSKILARRKEYGHIKDLMQKQLEAEIQKEKDYFKDHKMSIWDLFGRAGPPQPIKEETKE